MKSFLAILSTNEEMQTAIKTLGIADYVEELIMVHERLENKTDKRREDNSVFRIQGRKELKSEMLCSLSNLLKAIELGKVQHADLDYMPLIAELSELFIPYRALGRSRATKSMNEAIKNETVATSTKTSATAN